MPHKELSQLIKDTNAFYRTLTKAHCPLLNEDVYFNSNGFRHLIYKSRHKRRKVSEQRYKLELFPLAIPAIRNSKEMEGIRSIKPPSMSQFVTFYALLYTTQRKIRVKVIVIQSGVGKHFFHSIMRIK